ncbi:unnamed protein product [Bursaphelenchus okinawaensis]|uniref:Uncharacterized protein n=1 Tax=Bursaphelenchus okinawaensis TaxID=465554 RepID=A0A811KP31_9BILA|nr:unnamed protein product [Bursaphelenchus okinawaensis]CAG9107063.1 unnamed protein product [Bursaphelenchus okinawaensis]
MPKLLPNLLEEVGRDPREYFSDEPKTDFHKVAVEKEDKQPARGSPIVVVDNSDNEDLKALLEGVNTGVDEWWKAADEKLPTADSIDPKPSEYRGELEVVDNDDNDDDVKIRMSPRRPNSAQLPSEDLSMGGGSYSETANERPLINFDSSSEEELLQRGVLRYDPTIAKIYWNEAQKSDGPRLNKGPSFATVPGRFESIKAKAYEQAAKDSPEVHHDNFDRLRPFRTRAAAVPVFVPTKDKSSAHVASESLKLSPEEEIINKEINALKASIDKHQEELDQMEDSGKTSGLDGDSGAAGGSGVNSGADRHGKFSSVANPGANSEGTQEAKATLATEVKSSVESDIISALESLQSDAKVKQSGSSSTHSGGSKPLSTFIDKESDRFFNDDDSDEELKDRIDAHGHEIRKPLKIQRLTSELKAKKQRIDDDTNADDAEYPTELRELPDVSRFTENEGEGQGLKAHSLDSKLQNGRLGLRNQNSRPEGQSQKPENDNSKPQLQPRMEIQTSQLSLGQEGLSQPPQNGENVQEAIIETIRTTVPPRFESVAAPGVAGGLGGGLGGAAAPRFPGLQVPPLPNPTNPRFFQPSVAPLNLFPSQSASAVRIDQNGNPITHLDNFPLRNDAGFQQIYNNFRNMFMNSPGDKSDTTIYDFTNDPHHIV